MYKNIFLALCLAIACQAQVPFPGPCPNILPKQDFSVNRFYGQWYEMEKYFAIFQAGGKCVKATYTPFLIPGTVGVINQQLNFLTNIPATISGFARPVGLPNEARLSVVFPTTPFPAPYWVLETDYVSFAVVYSCVDLGFFHFKFVWLLSRERFASANALTSSYAVMDSRGIPRAFLLKTDQYNCPVTH